MPYRTARTQFEAGNGCFPAAHPSTCDEPWVGIWQPSILRLSIFFLEDQTLLSRLLACERTASDYPNNVGFRSIESKGLVDG